MLVPLVVGIVWLGLFPGPVLRRMEPATSRYVETVQPSRAEHRGRLGRGPGRSGGAALMQLDMSTPRRCHPRPPAGGSAHRLGPLVLLVASWRHGTAEDSRLAGWLSFAGIVRERRRDSPGSGSTRSRRSVWRR